MENGSWYEVMDRVYQCWVKNGTLYCQETGNEVKDYEPDEILDMVFHSPRERADFMGLELVVYDRHGKPIFERTEKMIDGYDVTYLYYGKYLVENPDNHKTIERKLSDEINWDCEEEVWESIDHDIHDQNPKLYQSEIGLPEL